MNNKEDHHLLGGIDARWGAASLPHWVNYMHVFGRKKDWVSEIEWKTKTDSLRAQTRMFSPHNLLPSSMSVSKKKEHSVWAEGSRKLQGFCQTTEAYSLCRVWTADKECVCRQHTSHWSTTHWRNICVSVGLCPSLSAHFSHFFLPNISAKKPDTTFMRWLIWPYVSMSVWASLYTNHPDHHHNQHHHLQVLSP